jgi:phospholipase C
VNHTVISQLAAINGGKMNGWQAMPGGDCSPLHHYRCIGGYKPSQIPNEVALANKFAISDRTFSMADSPSWGGHIYAVAGSLDGFLGDIPQPTGGFPRGPGWGCDSNRHTKWANPKTGQLKTVPSCIPDPSLPIANGGAFEPTPVKYIPTIMDRLDAAGLSWKLYGATKLQNGYIWSICPTFAECLYTRQDKSLVPDTQFFKDAAHGTLPAFSVVTPGGPDYLDSCHNATSMTACDNFIGSLVKALENSPDWKSTAVFITFDDCGCFYDQVPPPTNPDGTQEGPRVPMIIVSPYAKPGYTDTRSTTFEGILAYVEQNFGLSPLGVNDAQAYPFTQAFNYAQAPLRPVRMVDRPLPPSARRIHLTPALLNDPS